MFAFKTCLPHQSVMPFLNGAPLLRKILDPPLSSCASHCLWGPLLFTIYIKEPVRQRFLQVVNISAWWQVPFRTVIYHLHTQEHFTERVEWVWPDHNLKTAVTNCKCTFPLAHFGWKFWTISQDILFIFKVSQSAEPELSHHLHSDQNFWNFWVDVKQPLSLVQNFATISLGAKGLTLLIKLADCL